MSARTVLDPDAKARVMPGNFAAAVEYARREHGAVLESGTFTADTAATRAVREGPA